MQVLIVPLYQQKQTDMKFHKTFGQIEITNQDSKFTTIVIVETGEVKKLATSFANMLIQDEPFKSTKKAKSIVRDLTIEEKQRVEASVNSQMREIVYESSLFGEAKEIYKSNKSKRTHL